MTMYMIAGTQADKASNNKLTVMKLSRLHKTRSPGMNECEIVSLEHSRSIQITM
jgi:hypothetical protein